MTLRIIGAGLAGLLAAHAWPQARVLESSEQPKEEHKALLRFRSDAVAQLTGIEFRRVTVRKGIWFGGKFVSPSIGMANLYAQKVTGSLLGDRSIWNLEPVERWIAPETFYEELVANVGARITWGAPIDFSAFERATLPKQLDKGPVINTAPLLLVLQAVATPGAVFSAFKRSPIRVSRWRVKDADVFQTIYFPDPEVQTYRASITGSLLIVESMTELTAATSVAQAFGLKPSQLTQIDEVEQKYGKIIPLPDAYRKRLLHELTSKYGIFSLGRFATWRNILLDDVVQDIAVLRRLMRASSYDRELFAK